MQSVASVCKALQPGAYKVLSSIFFCNLPAAHLSPSQLHTHVSFSRLCPASLDWW